MGARRLFSCFSGCLTPPGPRSKPRFGFVARGGLGGGAFFGASRGVSFG